MSGSAAKPDYATLLKESFLSLEKLSARVKALEAERSEPIAIVGLGCRLPGADSPEAFWRLLRDGVDAIREVPADRWKVDEYYDADPDAPGKLYSRWGGFIDGIDRFDPQFFGISAREATSMDPQQRLLLEVTWEALEHAAIRPDGLAGSATGVFVGISTSDYALLQPTSGDSAFNLYAGTGNATSVASGRLSYALGLQGPSVSVDTACSASLMAVHLAIESLRRRECTMALAGGVNVILCPGFTIVACKGRMLAFDGRCKTFDSAADGYVRSEGCGIVVLKRLADALAAGDRVLAVLRGSAANQDGRSTGLTAPNGLSQELLIRTALKNAGMVASQVDYVEAHGTGTPLGDPIEMRAIGAALGEGRAPDRPLFVGSVKTNVGHLEATAGVAALIKVVLSLQHGTIPAHLHFRNPSPHIAWNELPVRIPRVTQPWPSGSGLRAAGVSSFGFSGTNVHLVVEEAPRPLREPSAIERPCHVLPLSARSEAALDAVIDRFVEWSEREAEADLGDVAFTAGTGRAHFKHRVAVVGRDLQDAVSRLRDSRHREVEGLYRGVVLEQSAQKVAFLFSCQGTQHVGMGRLLYETQPTFRAAMDRCDALFAPYTGESVTALLYGGDDDTVEREARLLQTVLAQPALFALEYALAQVWLSWGVKPGAILGHSLGEYAAACIAGMLSLEDAVLLVAERGRLMQSVPTAGSMAAVMASEAVARSAIAPFAATVSIAAVNGPESVVLSGATEDLKTILEELTARGVECRLLGVSLGSHSSQMAPILDEFERAAARVKFQKPRFRLLSNVTGGPADPDQMTRPQYWRQHLAQPVLFAPAMQWLYQQGFRTFLELGPHTTLVGLGVACVPAEGTAWLPSLRKGVGDWDQMLAAVGQMYARGVEVDWAGMDRDYRRARVALPTYPFERQRYWVSRSKQGAGLAGDSIHPLLGAPIDSPVVNGRLFQTTVSLETIPFVQDHLVFGTPVLPPVAFLEAARAAAMAVLGDGAGLERIAIEQPLLLRESEERVLQTAILDLDEEGARIEIYSRAATDVTQSWTRHFSGRLRPELPSEAPVASDSLEAVRARCRSVIDAVELYEKFAAGGMTYGPAFQSIEALWHSEDEALASLRLPSDLADGDGYAIHPALLNGMAAVVGALAAVRETLESVYVPVEFGTVQFLAPVGPRVWAHTAWTRGVDGGQYEARLRLFDEEGALALEATHVLVRRATSTPLRAIEGHRALEDWLHELDWEAVAADSSAGQTAARWIVLRTGDTAGVSWTPAPAESEAFITVRLGLEFARPAPAEFIVNPLRRDDFDRLLDAIGHDAGRMRVVVDASACPEQHITAAAALDDLVRRDCASVLHLVQALVARCAPGQATLSIVTRGAQSVGADPDPVRMEHAPLWGLARVVALEHPELRCRILDLDPAAPAAETDMLQQELRHDGIEDQVAFRGAARFARRLVPRGQDKSRPPRAAEEPREFDAQSTYLITGGCGGLGLKTAEWLVAHGAQRLVLTGRSAPSAEAVVAIQALERAGAVITVARGDVSSADDVRRILQEIAVSGSPLRGIVHAAGVLNDGLLTGQSWDDFEQVFAPKVRGSFLLHDLTRDQPLDFFVMFSSAAAVLGGPGQSNYAAANAFMDALAAHRRARGAPALSINWGPWAETGMVTRLEDRDRARLSRRGMDAIPAADGMRLLGRLLSQSASNVVAIPIRWRTVLQDYASGAEPPLFRIVARQVEGRASQPARPKRDSELKQRLAGASPEERTTLLLSMLRAQLSAVLGFGADTELETGDSFTTLGLDSLMTVELKNRVETALGVQLPLRLFVGSVTADQLAAELSDLFKATTTEELVERVSSPEPTPTWRSLVPIQMQGSGFPLFLVPAVTGNILVYEQLAAALGTERPLYGLQSVGLDGVRDPLKCIEEIAEHFVSEMRTVQPHGPYHLVGACMGGVIAFEMARRLRGSGEDVALLALVDSWLASDRLQRAAHLMRYSRPFVRMARRGPKFFRRLRAMSPALRRQYVKAKFVGLVRRRHQPKSPAQEWQRVRARMMRANMTAYLNYRPQGGYDGHIALVLAADRHLVVSLDKRLDWPAIASSCSVYRLPGKNSGVLLKHHAVRVAECLSAELARAGAVPVQPVAKSA